MLVSAQEGPVAGEPASPVTQCSLGHNKDQLHLLPLNH